MSVGFPATIKLYSIFGKFLSDAFDVTCAYHVGSSLFNKGWRDVDVVVLLEDEDFEKMFGTKVPDGAKWEAYCAAFSALGKEVTGLPIDFKVQPRMWANEKFEHPKHLRGAMIGGFHERRKREEIHQTECYNSKCSQHDGDEPVAVCDGECPDTAQEDK